MKLGFVFEAEEPRSVTYASDQRSMMTTVYKTMLSVARKPLSPAKPEEGAGAAGVAAAVMGAGGVSKPETRSPDLPRETNDAESRP